MIRYLFFLFPLLLQSCGEELSKPPVVITKPIEIDPFSNIPELKEMVIYEANMKAFSPHGTLSGVTNRLDEIKSLEVNVLWLMPIYPIGQVRSVNSPYSIRSYMEVNSDLGTISDLIVLVNEAHSRDMAVILDWVANHTAWDHPWITQHSDWYSKNSSGEIIIPPGTNWNDVAELNFNNADMRAEMIASMKYWIDSVGIDGFRCDAVDFVPSSFWAQAIQELEAASPNDLIILAEGGEKENFTSGFEMNYSWSFYATLESIYASSAWASSLTTTHSAEYQQVVNGGQKLRYITNHDVAAWEISPVDLYGLEGSVGAYVATSFMGGIPLIYTGQEIGHPTTISFFENDPLDWSINPEIFEAYQQIMEVREAHPAVIEGSLSSFSSRDVIAFRRVMEGDDVLVLVNTRDMQVTFTLPTEVQNTIWKDDLSAGEESLFESITLGAKDYKILSR